MDSHPLMNLISTSYNDLLIDLSTQATELRHKLQEMKVISSLDSSNYSSDGFKQNLNSENLFTPKLKESVNLRSGKGDKYAQSNILNLVNKINRVEKLIRRVESQLGYILKNVDVINNFKNYMEEIRSKFNYDAISKLEDLVIWDKISVIFNLISGVTPTLIKFWLNTSKDYKYLDDLIAEFNHSVGNFKYDVYSWDPVTKRGTSTGFRYLANCSIDSLINATTDKSQDEFKRSIATGVIRMLEKTTSQARYGNIWIQILSFLMVKQVENSKSYFSNLPDSIQKNEIKMNAVDTYSFQLIIRLLYKHQLSPFRIKKGNLIINKFNKVDWSTQLPILLSILVNGVILELTGILDDDAAKIYTIHMMTGAKTSIIDYLLLWKSKFRRWIKLGIKECKKLGMLKWEAHQPIGITYNSGKNEVFLVGEEKELQELVDEYPEYYKKYVLKLLNMLRSFDFDTKINAIHATLLIRHCLMTSHSISCGSNYNKTSPALCLLDAYGTKLNFTERTPDVIKQVEYNGVKLNLEYSWSQINPLYDKIAQQLEIMVAEAYSSSIFNSIEQEYVSFLTNRSGGVKYVEDFNSLPFKKLPEEVQKVSQTRIINFLLTSKLFYTLMGIDKLCKGKTTAGYREQIDRRMRVIAVVKNIMQLLTLPLILIFNEMKSKVEEIAMGKQVGNILDALLQIESSSTPHGFMTSSDVSGMDASMLKQIAMFIRHTIVNKLDTLMDSDSKVFAFNKLVDKEIINIKNNYDINSNFNQRQDNLSRQDISALKIMIAYLENQDGRNEMEATDGYFIDKVSPSDQTFKSGELFTSGNHTVLLISIVRNLLTKPKWSNLRSKFRVLGDDFFLCMSNSEDSNLILEFLGELRDDMKAFNLKLELDGSRFYGDFLQQSALCGLFVPKPSRSSIQNVERNDVADRNPIDIIRMVIDTSAVTSNRVYSQNNMIPIIRSIWMIIRSKKYLINNRNIAINTPKLYKGILATDFSNDEKYITLPFMLISVCPINYPPIIFDDTPNKMIRLSYLTPSGDFMYNYWYNVFMNNEVLIEIPATITKQWLTSSFMNNCINWDAREKFGITLSEHLLEFKRSKKMSEYKVNSIGHDVIKILQNVFIQHIDQSKLKRSNEAMSVLFQNNIKVPYGLTFEGREKNKVILSFESKLESQDEQEYLDELYIEHINSYMTIPSNKQSKYLFNTFVISISNRKREQLSLTNALNGCGAFIYLPIIPACHKESDLLFISQCAGFVNPNDYRITASINRLGESGGFGFDVDRAVDFGVQLCKTNFNMLDSYIEVLGLGTRDSLSFKQIVIDIYRRGFKTEYQSIFPLNKYFISPGDAEIFGRLISRDSLMRLSQYIPIPNLNLLARDIMYAYGMTLQSNFIELYSNYYNWLMVGSESNSVIHSTVP